VCFDFAEQPPEQPATGNTERSKDHDRKQVFAQIPLVPQRKLAELLFVRIQLSRA